MSKIIKNSFRGYVSSRPINGNTIPQSLQNLKIRDYALSKNVDFKLSITEYRMKKTYYALNSLKKEINKLEGVIFFSIYQLPDEKLKRSKFLNYFIKKKKKLFFALEDVVVKTIKEIEEIELIYFISKVSAKQTS
jgi:sporadic carbohydrate cluster protein (TIGR04323 family)